MESIFIHDGKRYQRVSYTDILYIEALKDYILIYTTKKRFIINRTMKEVWKKLRPYNFDRVHRSYIVNLNRITHLNSTKLMIQDKEIPIGKLYRSNLLKRIQKL